MSNYKETQALLLNYLRAQTPFVVLRSVEPARVRQMLEQIRKKLSTDLIEYSELHGFSDQNRRSGTDEEDPLTYLAKQIRERASGVYVLYDLRYMDTDTAYSRQMLNLVYLARERGCSIVLVCNDEVWVRLSQNGLHLKLDLPSTEERIEQIESFVAVKCKGKHAPSEADIVRIANMLGGMSSQQIEMLLRTALVSADGLSAESALSIAGSKGSIYGRIPSITEITVSDHIRVSGLSSLKQWLSNKKKVFWASDAALDRRNLTAPKGVLLCGITGCGKSLSAKLIAREWGLPLYRFDIENILNKYVGESEKNMRAALEYIDNVSPCVLWIDEIEKIFHVGGSEDGTSKRILGQFLFWMQESKRRVFLVATANQIDMLPAELFRNGRFSAKFFLDLPTAQERKEAIELYSTLCILRKPDEALLSELTAVSEGFSYADIETAVKNMAEEMMIQDLDSADPCRFKAHFLKIISTEKANPEVVRKNREWGKTSAQNASDYGCFSGS